MAPTPIYQLKTFADIYTAIREELKIQSTDTTAIQRIQRDVNIIYMDEVIPFSQWKWLRGVFDTTIYAAITAGTANVTQGSNTVTLTVPISSSKKGWLFGIVGYNEVYRIAQHTSNSSTITLQAPYTGGTNTVGQYKIWTDEIYLPSFVRETFNISNDFSEAPLTNCGLQQYRGYVAALPRAEGRPLFYTTDHYYDPIAYTVPSGMPAISTRSSDALTKTLIFASDVSNYIYQGDNIEISAAGDPSYNGQFVVSSQSGTTITYTGTLPIFEATIADSNLVIKKLQPQSDSRRSKRILVYPAIFQQNTTLHIDFIREVNPLQNDSDEPFMPIGDRSVLLYGGLHRAWSRERNPEEAKRNGDLFVAKLARMAGKMDDSIDQPKLVPNKIYLGAKRMAQRQKDSRTGLPEGWGGGSGAGSTVTGQANTVAIFNSVGQLTSSSITTVILNYLSTVNSPVYGSTDVATLSNKTLLDSTTFIANVTDQTKRIGFSAGGQTAGVTSTLIFTGTATSSYTFPSATDTVCLLALQQNLSNKNLLNTTVFHADTADPTKRVGYSSSGAATGTTSTLGFSQSANRQYIYPDTSDTLALLAFQQNLSNKNLLNTTVFHADTADTTKRVGYSSSGSVTGTTGTFGFALTANRQWTLPDVSDALTSATNTQTFTNKTFSTGTNIFNSSTATSGQVLTADGTGASNWQTSASTLDSPLPPQNTSLGYTISSSALTIRLLTKTGSTPTGGNNATIPFRSSVASSGIYNVRSITSAVTLTLPLNTTIGTTSGKTEYVYVYGTDNAGTIGLAASLSGYWDEGGLQSVSAVTGGASATTLYTSSGFSNLPIRLLGRFSNNQAIAGNWVSFPGEASNIPFNTGSQMVVSPASSADSSISISSYAIFGTSPILNITASKTGRYKIYGTFEVYNITGGTIGLQIASSGAGGTTPTTVFIQDAILDSSAGDRRSASPFSIFDLVEGNSYIFALYGKASAQTTTLANSGPTTGHVLVCERIT